MSPSSFEHAVASVPGGEHLRSGKNCQDGVSVEIGNGFLVAVVCDGCGSSPHSETGAKLGAKLISADISGRLSTSCPPPDGVRLATIACHNAQRSLANLLGWFEPGEFSRTVQDYFLFSVVGLILSEKDDFCLVFSVGDGVFTHNGVISKIGPFKDNAPPYLGYAMLSGSAWWALPTNFSAADALPQIRLSVEAKSVTSVAIGTDGAFGLMDAETRLMPGKSDTMGPMSQFWEKDVYFSNKDAMRRRLSMAAKDVKRAGKDGAIELSAGIIPDDTTLVVVRRKKLDKQ